MSWFEPNSGRIQHDAVVSHVLVIFMAEVVVEPLGGLITLRNKPIQSKLPAGADNRALLCESSFDEARLQRAAVRIGMLLRSI